MPNSNIFNPQEFFENTAYYASQGRGLFTLTKKPHVLENITAAAGTPVANRRNAVNMGWELLSKGIMAKSISVAGYNLATFEEFSYIGPTRKHPHTQIFGPMTVEFFLMGTSRQQAAAIYHTFLTWQEAIAGARFSSTEVDRGARSDSTFFAIEYYDNYVSEAEVKIYSPQSAPNDTPTPVIRNIYREIYPQALGGLSVSWENSDTPLTLSVTFEYFHTNSLILTTSAI